MYKQQNYKIYEAKTNRTRKRNKITVGERKLNKEGVAEQTLIGSEIILSVYEQKEGLSV